MATSSVLPCSSRSACRSIFTRGSKWHSPRSARSGSTLQAFACSPSTKGRSGRPHRSFPEAGKGSFGGGNAAQPSAMCGRKEVRRASLAGKEQTVVDRGSEPCSVIGMAGTRIGIGTAGPRVAQPGGGGKRGQLRADTAAEEAGEFAGGEGEHRRLPFRFERRRKTTAEKAVDRGAIERPHLIAHGFPRGGRADEVGIVLDPGKRAVQRNEELVVDPERQPSRSGDLVRQRRVEAEHFA